MGLEDRLPASDNPSEDTLPIHQFSFVMREYARGKVTTQEALDIINSWLETPLDAPETADLVAIKNSIDAAATLLGKLDQALEVGDVCGLAEMDSPGYQTRAELKAKIGF